MVGSAGEDLTGFADERERLTGIAGETAHLLSAMVLINSK